ncbi:DUF2726 domain-containing protein [Paraglaciecola sp. MB-3u-78]|jgi:hypothetical protein|uniref:DUF2726 domain-containing protein n=1 Tax=Paraglaciecola sp. MB-3u-78 TaxID=2058332 RepID=UPI000C34F586|nr:DUF2726 domain-containing protein [Paraglaciecola sp. MB-3u-78]PKG99835.1 hypothetical protein CXF95_03980 [Paraglaciecola sp. MB-3u-78]
MELAIVLMMLLIIVAVGAMKLYEPGLAFPFKKKGNLFTPVERTFLGLIEEAVGNEFRILCRVKMSDILTIHQNVDKKTSKNAASRAGSKRLDFVLCSKEDMSPIIAIDLVHNNGKDGYKSQRDFYVSGALDAAHIPHVRIKVRSGYKAQDIRECIQAKLPKPRLKDSNAPTPQRGGKLTPAFARQAKPTRPIQTNKTVPSRPVAAA